MSKFVRTMTAHVGLILVIAVLVAISLVACATPPPATVPAAQSTQAVTGKQAQTSPTTSSPELADKQVLTLGWPIADLNPTDPAQASTGDTWFIATEVANGLVRYAPGSIDITKIQPDLAERWETSKDGLTWTFYLRKGVQFHKGYGEFTAEDVKYSYDRFKDPKVKAAYGRPTIKQIDVVDPYTVRFTLTTPDSFFLNQVANWNGGWIVSKKAVEQMGLEAFSRAPVGTGPFQIGAYVAKESLTLDANGKYFRGKSILDKIVIKFMGADENVRALALQNGDIQMVRSLNNTDLSSKLIKDGYQQSGRWGNRHVLHFKLTEKPFSDLKVRQAIAYGIDRNAIVAAAGGQYKILYSHLTPAQSFALNKEDIPEELRYEYNPDKARQLLSEAGYPNGFTTKLIVPERSFLTDMLVVQDQLKKIGVTLDLQVVDWNKWLATTRQGTNPIEIWSGLEATPDQAFRDYFYTAAIIGKTGAVRNWSHYGEAVGNIDKQLDDGLAILDPAAQQKLYRDIQFQLLKDLPSFPLVYQSTMDNISVPYLDLGYKFEDSLMTDAPIVETTRLLKKK